MQCPTCNVVYSNGLDNCPRCKTPAPEMSVSEEIPETETVKVVNNGAAITENVLMKDKQPETKSQSSTLIAFPGKKRQEMPAWRKELLEKFKEIQDKRAREAEEEEAAKAASVEETSAETPVSTEEPAKPHLEVVQPAPVNPIVAKALERIERANSRPVNASTNTQPKTNRAAVVNGNLSSEQEDKEQRLSLIQPQQKVKAVGMSAAASGGTQIHSRANSAVATKTQTVIKQVPDEDNYNISRNGTASAAQAVADISPVPTTQSFSSGQISKASSAAGIETIKTESTKEVLKEISTEESEIPETLSASTVVSIEESFTEDDDLHYDDYAPYMPRMVSVVFDVFVIIFAASPFAAVMELSNVDWTNERILISLGAILLLVSFFYLMASVAILGRTWGMATLSMRVADAETGESPSFGQSTARAFLFLLSVAAAFLPFLYTLFDAEGRALHDRIAGTIIVREE